MEDKTNKAKSLLLVALMALLFLPMFQDRFSYFELEPLQGAITAPVKDTCTEAKWFSGEYQEKIEKYLNESFGFRSTFIRINNQIGFQFFNRALANGVIIGKENCLYEKYYINAYTGKDFVGKDSITHIVNRLKFIQDTLSKLNKNLIFVFASGKATYFPEYIPDKYFEGKKDISNYLYYLEQAKAQGLNYIDFNGYFASYKSKTPYPLYSKFGIHWSEYGMCLAMDSIVHYIEKQRGIDMPDLQWGKIEEAQPRGADYDIGDGMNLLFRLKQDQLMGYPKVEFIQDPAKVKPNVLVIADSHYWGLSNYGITAAFNNTQFWFYNRSVYPESFTKPLDASELNLKNELPKYDVIMIIATEMTLPDAGWGFVDNAYNVYKGTYRKETPEEYKANLDFQRRVILGDEKWMTQIRQKAQERKLSVDSMVTLDAIWMLEHRE